MLNRWVVYGGKKIVLEIGSFLNYRDSEYVRGITVAIDLRLMTPPIPKVMTSSIDPILIAELSSDVTVGLFLVLNGSTRQVRIHYKNSASSWAFSVAGNSSNLSLDTDRVVLLNFVRSIVDPSQMVITLHHFTGPP